MLDLTVLCSVVDNYGDIGFVFRLCRRISEIAQDIKLRLVVDNLESFSFMNSKIDPSKAEQEFNGWTILDWKNEEVCRNSFLSQQPEYILQCFQCLRPEWLDDILFSDSFKGTAHIIDVEYLTAEEWADDFHLKKSGTRSVNVKKTIFMPGFTEKTGGLVLDSDFMKSKEDRAYAVAKAGEKLDGEQKEILESDDWYKILVFSYPRSFDFLVEAIDSFSGFCDRKVHVFLAKGISVEPFEKSCQGRNLEFSWSRLPSLEQQQWDAFICSMDFNFIRGEDSFSRGALSGVPFVWHAYVQDDEFQLVKLNAFLERMRPFMDDGLFEDYRRFSFLYNRAFDVEPGDEACQVLAPLAALPSVEETAFDEMRDLAIKLLSGSGQARAAFNDSACHFIGNGDLAENLLAFLRTCNLK
ncbi:MAG: elongation factor P maturation arginine rhamnosyltransferase EarP [Treponema sp.]|nr:elongation factor P maturation arginine rhamnosyltransferase EarP [Candidatus Treponema equi]